MSDPVPHDHLLSVEAYLQQESDASIRHEYLAGGVYALSGGSLRHNKIALNIATRLRAAIVGGPCAVFINDVKVRAADDVFYYPDVVVTCAPAADSDVYLSAPCLIVEVTSPGTATIDRREKLISYRQIPTLQAYVVVDQMRRRVEVHGRAADGDGWVNRGYTGDDTVHLRCVEVTLTLEQIYEGVAPLTLGEGEGVEYSE